MVQKRYVGILDLYLFAETDEEAIIQIKELAKKIAEEDDNRCGVVDLVEQPIGTLNNRKIKIFFQISKE